VTREVSRQIDAESLLTATLSRRTVLRTMTLGAGAGLLAACSTQTTDDSRDDGAAAEVPEPDDDPAGDELDDVEEPGSGEDDADQDDGMAEDDERPELIVAVQGIPETLDPYQHLSNVGTRVTYSMFDHLLERQFQDGDPPGTGSDIGPMLAESRERIDDLTLDLHLREDVLFHDGTPMTADDVVFTFERSLFDTPEEMLDAEGYVSTISEIEALDDYTVRIHTHEPDPLLEMRLTSWATWILPRAYYEEVGIDAFALDPIGTGPFKLTDLQPDNHLILEAFDDYWGGPPPASRVTFRVIPEVSTRVAAVVSGEAHIATNIPPDQAATLEDADGVQVQSVPLANVHLLRYNVNFAPLEDQTLRQAMNLAIDRELLVETLWSGMAEVPRGHQFPEYGDMYNPDRPIPPYDPDQARELVEQSDYDGEPIVFRVSPFYYTNGIQSAEAIAEMWNAVGINAEVEVRDNPYDEGPEAIMVTNWSNSSFVADPDGALWLRWGADYPGTQEFFWYPDDERFNELGAEARTTMDSEFRFEAYQTMLDIWEEEAPGTVLYIPHEIYGVREGVNWTPYSFYYMDLRAGNLQFD
jgi:peptide/nickel transport system substrate-binding protein